ncbi:MMPL family transporter [Maridesulfovibrio sp.]|uniref:MMPL family transporter n=1 Tax=Maridesulfovibrio sp. TaxID=2795000 RepID=UPI0029F5772B|nr:MMPL family transporter [Maridesulfovibrio sp.]
MFSRKANNHSASDWKTQLKYLLILLIFLLCCALPLRSVSFTEDISTMLPSGENEVISKDFALLQKVPFAGKVLISISSETLTEENLSKVAEDLARKLSSPLLFIEDNSGVNPQAVVDFLLRQAPNLTTKSDVKKLQELTSTEMIRRNLAETKKQLISPAGMGMRNILAADPLNLRSIYLRKLSSLQNLPRLKISSGQYFIAGKNALLIVAGTNVPMTDVQNGQKLLNLFKKIKQTTLAENNLTEADISIDILSGHRYTAANSSIIKRDIYTVSIISICALALLFFLAFRSRGALSIFLAPGVAIIAGMGCCAFFYRDMSAIVIGFGAVLMGISIDFAVHTYFALAENPGDKNAALREISKPMLFGAATSCVSFTALYISGIAGIRQLSVFAVAGIIAACGYALFFVPRFCGSLPSGQNGLSIFSVRGNKKAIIWSTFIIMGCSIGFAFNNNFDSELKNLGYISSSLSRVEKHFHEKWGEMRARSILFSQAETMDEALHINENAWSDIQINLKDTKAVSIAPMLPSSSVRQENNARWLNFWNENKVNATQTVIQESMQLGFTAQAFKPAMDRLSAQIPPLNAEVLLCGPLAPLAKMFIPVDNSGATRQVITMLPDNKKITDYYTPQKEKELGVRLVAQSRFKAQLEQEMKRDIIKFISISGLLVAVLIFALFRDLRRAALAVFPAVFGVALTFGLLGMLRIPLNIFHIVALPLVIGLGADYGIFMVFQEIRTPSPWTVKAVKISGLTTLAGFGVLVFAKHPAMSSLGATVSIGISSALCCAVFVLPHLLRLKGDDHA